MPTIQDLLSNQYEMLYGMTLMNLSDMTPEDSLVEPDGGANTANWVLGHLITVHNGAMQLLDQASVVPAEALAGAAPEPADRPDEPMDWELLTSRFAASKDRCLAAIAAVSDEALAEPMPHPFGGESTRGELLQLVAMHGTYHAGQLAMCRRAAEREGVIKGPRQR
ncbi:MAG TPA: DinB family protein [Gemmatimonadales bacterium]|nr:DinB family protein [Gemmatimonadales bacterium]